MRYLRNVFPLIDLGWDRARCVDYLAARGFEKTVKSACVGCPFPGNAGWRRIRDIDSDGWAEAVEFDRAIRHGYPHATEQGQQLRGQYFLHPARPRRPRHPSKSKRHLRLIATAEPSGGVSIDHGRDEDGDPDTCAPPDPCEVAKELESAASISSCTPSGSASTSRHATSHTLHSDTKDRG